MKTIYKLLVVGASWTCLLLLIIHALEGNDFPISMVVFPLVYSTFATGLFMFRDISKSKYRITLYVVISIQWMRCVFLPVFGVFSGKYSSLFNSQYFNDTWLLMFIEEIAVWCVCFYFAFKNRTAEQKNELNKRCVFAGTPVMYVLFAIFAFVLYFVFARDEQLFSFIILDVGEDGRVSDESGNSLLTIITTIVTTAITFIALTLIYKFYRLYEKTESKRWIYLSMLVAGLMLCIIIGEQRNRQLFILFAYVIVLVSLFPQKKKSIALTLGIVAGAVLVFMSIYKFFNAFLYDSYFDAIQNAEMSFDEAVGMVDSYFYGFSVVNKNLGFVENTNISTFQIFSDLFRNTFGVHYVFRGHLSITEIYNLYLYSGEQSAGHLFSAIAYGYMTLGWLAPIMTVLNLAVAAFLESKIGKVSSIEWKYVLSTIYMRFAFSCFSCFAPLLNVASRTVIINAVVIVASGLLMKKHSKVKVQILGPKPLKSSKGL